MDFAPILGSISVTAIITAIGAVAAIKVLPNFTRWGYSKVTGMFGR